MAGHDNDDDDRANRRDLTGLAGGAFLGGLFGLLIGIMLAQTVFAVLAVIAVAAAGALLGRLVAARVSVDDWDPRASDRPFVGMHTPDDDGAGGPPQESARLRA